MQNQRGNPRVCPTKQSRSLALAESESGSWYKSCAACPKTLHTRSCLQIHPAEVNRQHSILSKPTQCRAIWSNGTGSKAARESTSAPESARGRE
ncbi:Hypothetical predicted protein [Cloeon dipterum]|uniref:Uncharacterized protein n=1 Tax=Cloeon dipterum TaxID=197152 RepID=A0A8S1D204_9INSE|nr:Hypothetical predicted protein [Cloeon dipterum]